MVAEGGRWGAGRRRMLPKKRRSTVAGHKYTVGQTVQYTAGAFGRSKTSGSFQVVKLLPSEGDEFLYRIKCEGEPYERVAKESQLDA
jgi:hypothetical protein